MMVCFSIRHTKFGCADIQVNPMLQLVMPVNNFPKVVENQKKYLNLDAAKPLYSVKLMPIWLFPCGISGRCCDDDDGPYYPSSPRHYDEDDCCGCWGCYFSGFFRGW